MSLSLPAPRKTLVEAGLTATADADRRAGRTVSVYRGVHVDKPFATGFLTRTRAAVATQPPRSVVGMRSAAALLRLPWVPAAWSDPGVRIDVAVAPDVTRRHRPGLRLHWRRLDERDRVDVAGCPCMSPTRTLFELARDPTMPALLVVQLIDGALRFERTTLDRLAECAARFPGERYVARARSLIARARPGVDSPPETELRLLLEDGGIESIDVDIRIEDRDGLVLARGDLGTRRLLLWGEYDGYDSHVGKQAFRKDRVGDRWLERRGWHVLRFVDVDLRRPEQTCREWRQAIADAPARIAALDPRRSPEIAAARRFLGFDPPA